MEITWNLTARVIFGSLLDLGAPWVHQPTNNSCCALSEIRFHQFHAEEEIEEGGNYIYYIDDLYRTLYLLYVGYQ